MEIITSLIAIYFLTIISLGNLPLNHKYPFRCSGGMVVNRPMQRVDPNAPAEWLRYNNQWNAIFAGDGPVKTTTYSQMPVVPATEMVWDPLTWNFEFRYPNLFSGAGRDELPTGSYKSFSQLYRVLLPLGIIGLEFDIILVTKVVKLPIRLK